MPGRHCRPRRAWSLQRILVVLVATIGVGVLLYPTAAAWSSDRVHAGQLASYLDAVAAMPNAELVQAMAAAREYNEMLPAGPLRDPWALSASGERIAVGEGTEAYHEALSISPDGVMARLHIPKIGVDLPVFHGADENTLAGGIGHLYGSGLPIGGEGTHAVLTGHSGFVQATLFNNLHNLQIGDQFTITVLDQVLTYQVDQKLTVLPDDTTDLVRVPGKDYVTLVTCTPTGVNTHRLLVRGIRVPTPTVAASDTTDSNAPAQGPGFPWWAVGMCTTPIGATALTGPRKHKPAHHPSRPGRPGRGGVARHTPRPLRAV